MTKKTRGCSIGAALLAVALAWGGGRTAAAAEAVPLNVILSLTGPASFLGKQQRVAFEIGEKLINQEGGIAGRPVKFVFSDDASSPQIGVQLLNQILAEKPQIILGSSIVAVCSAMAPLLRQGPVDFCLSPAIHPEPGSYIFTSDVSTSDCWAVMLRYFRLRGLTRLALITSTDASGQDAERGILQAAKLPENAAIKILVNAHFNPSDVNVSAQIAQMQASHPQVVLAMTTGAPLATVLKGLIQAGLDTPVAVPYSNMTFAQMSAYADFLPKELYFPVSEWPPHGAAVKLDPAVEAAQAKFYAAFKAAGAAPDVAPTIAWDPMMLVVNALQKLGPTASAAQIRDYIAHLRNYAGVNGIYDFKKTPQRGLNEDDVVMTRWVAAAKKWEIVSKPTGLPVGE